LMFFSFRFWLVYVCLKDKWCTNAKLHFLELYVIPSTVVALASHLFPITLWPQFYVMQETGHTKDSKNLFISFNALWSVFTPYSFRVSLVVSATVLDFVSRCVFLFSNPS
jgi:hypothetical protein